MKKIHKMWMSRDRDGAIWLWKKRPVWDSWMKEYVGSKRNVTAHAIGEVQPHIVKVLMGFTPKKKMLYIRGINGHWVQWN